MTELYDCVRYGAGASDFRLVPRRPIRTRDAVLTGNEPVPKNIALGRVWTGTAEEIRDFVTDPVRPLQAGKNFALGEVVEAEDIEEYEKANGRPAIDLGTTWTALSKDQLNENMEEVTTDARSGSGVGKPIQTGGRLLRGVRSAFFDASRTRSYAETLKKGREMHDAAAPARVTNAADYAATLAAGRKARGE